MVIGHSKGTELPICAKLRRAWPISTLSPELGERPVNPDGPEAAAMLQTAAEALDWFVRHERSITNDISSAHSGRGAGASEWMREDDSDFRDDLRKAFDRTRATLERLNR